MGTTDKPGLCQPDEAGGPRGAEISRAGGGFLGGEEERVCGRDNWCAVEKVSFAAKENLFALQKGFFASAENLLVIGKVCSGRRRVSSVTNQGSSTLKRKEMS